MKVLIADDDPVSRRLLQVTLSNFGYETVLATDGAEALSLAEQDDSPRLLVLDWVMPQMDGIEVCRRIRRFGQESYFYIILLTVKGRQNEIVEGLDAGADDTLPNLSIYSNSRRACVRDAASCSCRSSCFLRATSCVRSIARRADQLIQSWRRRRNPAQGSPAISPRENPAGPHHGRSRPLQVHQ